MHRRNPGKHRASQDFCTPARASLCCWSPVNKGKGSTGGAPEYSTHCSSPGRSSCFARWFGGFAVRGLEPEQIGPAIIWSAVPLIPLAFTAALLLLRKFDPRLLLAIGLACTAFAAWLNSQYSSTWAAENFYRTELLTGVGQAFAFIGLVGCIVLQAIFAGALAKPEWVLTLSAFFHTVRIFGGTAGALYMGHFVAQREKLHSNLLGMHVSNGDWLTGQNIHAMTAGLYAKSSGLATAGARAVDLIAARVRLQAYSLSIIDGFLLIAWSCVCALILVALLRKSPLNYGDLSTVQQTLALEKESK